MNKRIHELRREHLKLIQITSRLRYLGLHAAVGHLKLAISNLDSEIKLWQEDEERTETCSV